MYVIKASSSGYKFTFARLLAGGYEVEIASPQSTMYTYIQAGIDPYSWIQGFIAFRQ